MPAYRAEVSRSVAYLWPLGRMLVAPSVGDCLADLAGACLEECRLAFLTKDAFSSSCAGVDWELEDWPPGGCLVRGGGEGGEVGDQKTHQTDSPLNHCSETTTHTAHSISQLTVLTWVLGSNVIQHYKCFISSV